MAHKAPMSLDMTLDMTSLVYLVLFLKKSGDGQLFPIKTKGPFLKTMAEGVSFLKWVPLVVFLENVWSQKLADFSKSGDK